MQYWVFRNDKNALKFLSNEIDAGRLRQGWGWAGCDLRDAKALKDKRVKRNLPIFHKVKKGDILLVAYYLNTNQVAIVEATEDFNTGYKFELAEGKRDYGHVFPVKLLKSFNKNNENVDGKIRATLRNPSRFWNINYCKDAIDKLISTNDDELKSVSSTDEKFDNKISEAFEKYFAQEDIKKDIFNALSTQFQKAEWETALVYGLRKMFHHPIVVEHTAGREEAKHGSDITIRIPIFGMEYVIAIQVKDYRGKVDESPLTQVSKSDDYFSDDENVKLIDKYVIIIRAEKDNNLHLVENEQDVKIIFADDLKDLLFEITKTLSLGDILGE